MSDWLDELILRAIDKAGGVDAMTGKELLHLATMFNRLDLVVLLLEQGASPNRSDKHGRTPLFYAANLRMARTLLAAGADANHQDNLHHTPLHAASRAARLEVVEELVRAKARLNAQDKRGLTPLHQASVKGRVAAVEQLLALGANPNMQDRHGRHPLFYAVLGGHLDTAKALMQGGADLDMLDDAGTPWLSLAQWQHIIPLQSFSQTMIENEATCEWRPITSRPKHPRVRFQANEQPQRQSYGQTL